MKYRKIIGGLAAAVVLGSCGDSLMPVLPNNDSGLVNAVVELGFRPDVIEDHGHYFVVEGDIVIYKSSLQIPRRRIPNGPQFQYRTFNLVSQAAVQNIVVDTTGLESSWRTATADAITEWNAIPGSKINFAIGTPGNIRVVMKSLSFTNCSNGTVALGTFPSGSGQPGDSIRVNPNFTSCLSASQKKRNMAHELGHNVGFRHTNYKSIGESAGTVGAVLISGTDTSDAGSVMNGNTGAYTWSGFSYYDKAGAFHLYRDPFVVGQFTYPGSSTVIAWSAWPDSPQYRVFVTDDQTYRDENNETWDSSTQVYNSGWVSSSQVTLSGFSYTGASSCAYNGGSGNLGGTDRRYTIVIEIAYSVGYGVAPGTMVGDLEAMVC